LKGGRKKPWAVALDREIAALKLEAAATPAAAASQLFR